MTLRRAVWLLACAFALVFAPAARAHTPDTSYARIIIRPSELELRFTFDLFTLEKITEVDADHSRSVTPAELQQAGPAIAAFIRAHVRLALDGEPAALGEAGPPVWPRDAGAALGEADWHNNESLIAVPFRQPLAQTPRDVTIAFDVFEAFGERHTLLGYFEFAGHTEEVTFTQPEPDYLFDTTYAEPGSAPAPAPPTLPASLLRFLRLGIEHIFLGYDHLCFLIGLLVVSRLRELVQIITSFTVAHSITLILATLQIVHLPARLVECAVAGTIVYVAVENLVRKTIAHRWKLTFCFGLIHGFSFASTLSGLGLPTLGRIRCLLTFNVGVEIGQLVVIIAAFPLVVLLDRSPHARLGRALISAGVGLFGFFWLIERAFGWRFMPL